MRLRTILLIGAIGPFPVGPAWAQPSGHGVHPPMPGTKLSVTVEAPDFRPPIHLEVPLALPSTLMAAALDQAIELPEWGETIRALRYLPAAQLEQRGEADASSDAGCAVELVVEGATQSFRRWLLAGDPERNRLMSYIATWRYMTVADAAERDALYEQFRTEFTRAPTVRIAARSGSTWKEYTVEVGRTIADSELGVEITFKQFYPDYAIDQATLAATNQSARRRNPSVQVEIKQGAEVEDRWVFSKFPEFAHGGSERLPFRVKLECAVETEGATPDFAIVTIGKQTHEVWTRAAGAVSSSAPALSQRVTVPGSSYGFQLSAFLPGARIVETYAEAAKGKGRPAVEFSIGVGSAEPVRFWRELGQARRLETSRGAIWVGLRDQVSSSGKGHP